MKRIMIDIDKCDGCRNCAIACMQAHSGYESNIYFLNLSDLCTESRNDILINDQGKCVPLFCRHCDRPECVMSCMSGALTKDEKTGLVQYDEEKCAACFMCVMSCPFGVIKPDLATASKIIKCDFCKHDENGPSCVRNCPKQAIYVEEVASK